MLSETVVRSARTSIARSYRGQPGSVRAALPFDVADQHDIESWMRFRAASSSNATRYHGTDAWIIHSLIWDAKDAVRKAQRRLPRDDSGNLAPLGDLEGAQWLPDKSITDPDWMKAAETIAAVGAIAALSMGDAGPPGHGRSGRAGLTCLGRVFAVLHYAGGEVAANRFVQALAAEPSFRRLVGGDLQRRALLDAMATFVGTGNARRDLAFVGLPWPGTAQWNTFGKMFARVWERDDSGLKTVGKMTDRKERVA